MRALPIVRPCHQSFDSMAGERDTRHCSTCDKHVFDLSSRTEADATALLSAHEGERLCVRYAVTPRGDIRFVAMAAALSLAACSAGDHEVQSLQIGPIPAVAHVDAGFDDTYTMGDIAVAPAMPPTHAHCNTNKPPHR
jgi:hypothetical protein